MPDSPKNNSDTFSDDEKKDQDLFGNRPFRLVNFVYLAAFSFVAGYIYLLCFKINCTSGSTEPICKGNAFPEFLGQFGDAFGGVLNPLVGLVTLYLIIVNIKIQRKELELTRKELADSRDVQREQSAISNRQSFEQSFFARMSNYREILNSISFSERRYADLILNYNEKLLLREATGRAETHVSRPVLYVHLAGIGALAGLWNFEKSKRISFIVEDETLSYDHILELFNSIERKPEIESDPTTSISYKANSLFQIIQKSWFFFYEENRFYVDSLFKSLFELMSWVDKRADLNTTDRWQYLELVLAQLTNLELDILFHYGLFSAPSEHRALYEKVALLRDINNQDIVVKFIDIYRDTLPDHYGHITFDRDLAFTRYVE